MSSSTPGERTLTELDHVRLSKLTEGRAGPSALAELLDVADIVPAPDIAPEVITMYSKFLVVDAHSGQRQELTLCYSRDAAPGAGLVSVLSPVGTGLLGLRVGETARWRMPGGEEGGARVLEMLFQPEAHGDFTT